LLTPNSSASLRHDQCLLPWFGFLLRAPDHLLLDCRRRPSRLAALMARLKTLDTMLFEPSLPL
jgi:hypothetical protein